MTRPKEELVLIKCRVPPETAQMLSNRAIAEGHVFRRQTKKGEVVQPHWRSWLMALAKTQTPIDNSKWLD